MKKIFWIVFGVADLLLSQVSNSDPFAVRETDVHIVPKMESLPSASRVITEDLLNAFGEPRLGDNVLREGKPCFRIFTDPGTKHPTRFKWFMPLAELQRATLEVKQLERRDGKWAIFQDKTTVITADQLELLQKMLEEARPFTLPDRDWIPDDFGCETQWIYEFPLADGFIILIRKAPVSAMNKELLQGAKVPVERYSRESFLRSFTLMLWMISGAKDASPL